MKHELSADFSNPNHIAEMENKKRTLLVRGFLSSASKLYSIETIYYPGCRNDNILVSAVPEATVYYLDNGILNRTSSDGVFFHGDFTDPPFEPESFDALFLKDLHITESGKEHKERLRQILKPIKQGGLVIATRFDGCGIWQQDVPFVMESGLVKQTNIAFTPKDYLSVFLKV